MSCYGSYRRKADIEGARNSLQKKQNRAKNYATVFGYSIDHHGKWLAFQADGRWFESCRDRFGFNRQNVGEFPDAKGLGVKRSN